MPTNTTVYTIGDTVRLSFVVQSTGGTTGTTSGYTNATCTFVANPPAGDAIVRLSTSTGSTALIVLSTGQYYTDLIPSSSQHGRWTYEFRAAGAAVVTTGGAFAVAKRFATT